MGAPSSRARRKVLAGLAAAILIVVPASIASAAFNATTDSSANSVAADTLDPPTSLTATPNSGNIDLTWTPTVDTYADGYDVYRSTSTGTNFSPIASVTGQATSAYTDHTAPVFQNSTAAQGFASSAFLDKPAGTNEGDLLIAVFGATNCNATKPDPTGWYRHIDLNNNDISMWVYDRVATASEPSVYEFPFGLSCSFTANMLRYSGINTATPTETVYYYTSGSAQPVWSSAMPASDDDSTVVRLLAIETAVVTAAPAGHTLRTNQQVGSGTSLATADVVQDTAGDTGWTTWSVDSDHQYWSVTTVVRPHPGTLYYRLRATANNWESADSNEASG